MLSRYSRVPMEAKRHALDEIATRQRSGRREAQEGCPATGVGCGGFSIGGDSVIAGGSPGGVDASDGNSEIRRPGAEGRRGVHGMRCNSACGCQPLASLTRTVEVAEIITSG